MISHFHFQAEYEVMPDEKLGEKGKEIVKKYLVPEVRSGTKAVQQENCNQHRARKDVANKARV